ncbi:unnamed protein product [Amoebophrya sp. A25]|nr:unnamed protein product [Amoebophrya sp. A25]|eukprot:GSA25T00012127001.1
MQSHDDILCCSIPVETEKRLELLEIAKARAKGAFQTKDIRSAEKLYSRCIEVADILGTAGVEGKHLLYSNRAAVRLLKCNFQLALDDCEACMDLDAAFIKAHFRKCQALNGLERFEDAVAAAKTALELHVGNKELTEILATAETKLQEAKDKPKKVENPDDYRPKRIEPIAASGAANGGGAEEETSSPSKKKCPSEENAMRGYKKTADGKTTSYFHTELSAEAKALIGDCRPQKLEGSSSTTSTAGGAGSAWNQAGTFEERNFTTWFSEAVKKDVKGKFTIKCKKTPSDESVLSFSVTNVSGNAQITSSRGKLRHLVDCTIELKWKFPVPSTTAGASSATEEGEPPASTTLETTKYCRGTMKLESDGAGEYDINTTAGENQHLAKSLVNQHILQGDRTLQDQVVAKIRAVEAEFRKQNPFAR